MVTIEHDFDATIITLVDDGPAPLREDVTIRASEDGPLRVGILERPAFLTAVTGYPVSAAAAHEVVGRLKGRDAEPVADAP